MEEAQHECNEMANHLYNFLQDENVREELRQWKNSEAPDIPADDFEVTKFEADELIMNKIKAKIRGWEESNGLIKKASDNLTELFKTECQILGQEAEEINLIIEGDPIDDPLFLRQGLWLWQVLTNSILLNHKLYFFLDILIGS